MLYVAVLQHCLIMYLVRALQTYGLQNITCGMSNVKVCHLSLMNCLKISELLLLAAAFNYKRYLILHGLKAVLRKPWHRPDSFDELEPIKKDTPLM